MRKSRFIERYNAVCVGTEHFAASYFYALNVTLNRKVTKVERIAFSARFDDYSIDLEFGTICVNTNVQRSRGILNLYVCREGCNTFFQYNDRTIFLHSCNGGIAVFIVKYNAFLKSAFIVYGYFGLNALYKAFAFCQRKVCNVSFCTFIKVGYGERDAVINDFHRDRLHQVFAVYVCIHLIFFSTLTDTREGSRLAVFGNFDRRNHGPIQRFVF